MTDITMFTYIGSGIRTSGTRAAALALSGKWRRGALGLGGLGGGGRRQQRREVQAALRARAPRAAAATRAATATARGRPGTAGHRQEAAGEEGQYYLLLTLILLNFDTFL